MKFIEQYIKKKYKNLEVFKSHTTNSIYFKIDGLVNVRLSDHFTSKMNNKHINLHIVQCFKSNYFIILLEDNLIPLLKSRNDCKDFISVFCESLLVKKSWINDDEEFDKLKDCNNVSLIMQTITKRFPIYKHTENVLRKKINTLLKERKIDAVELFQILNKITTRKNFKKEEYNDTLFKKIEGLVSHKEKNEKG